MPLLFRGAGAVALAAALFVPQLRASCPTPIVTTELTPVATGQNPLDVAVADFNGDGYSDIVTPSTVTNNVRVRFGSISGVLSSPADYDVAAEPVEVRAALIDADTDWDIVTLNRTAATLSVLLNNGDGTFAADVESAVTANGGDLTIADVSGDGIADAIVNVAGSTPIHIYTGTGSGAFNTTPATLTSLGAVQGINAADVDGDGDKDILAGTIVPATGPTLEIFRNDGILVFTRTAFALQVNPIRVYPVDFDGSGTPDVAVTTATGTQVLQNDGSGSFAPLRYIPSYPSSIPRTRLAVVDVSDNGVVDLIIPNYTGQFVQTVVDGVTFNSTTTASGFSDWRGAAGGDFDGDARPDYVLVSASANRAVVFLNACQARRVTVNVSTSPASPTAKGQPITITGRVSPRTTAQPRPTGTIYFRWELLNQQGGFVGAFSPQIPVTDGPDNTATASYTFEDLPAGTLSMRAIYSGDGHYGNAVGGPITHEVLPPPFGTPPENFRANLGASGAYLEWNHTLGVDHYEIWRLANGTWALLATTTSNSYVDPVPANTTYVYKVRAIAPDGAQSGFTNPDIVSNFTLTSIGSHRAGSVIYAAHLNDLRRLVDQLLVAAGLGANAWTDPNVYKIPVRAIHWTELRTALDEARVVAGLAPLSYAEAIVAGVTFVRWTHYEEIRFGATI